MIVGNPHLFAIESKITQAYERLSYRALGCFVIHICGNRYGVYKDRATMLACSFDEVGRRLADRNSHTAAFACFDAGEVADAYLSAVFSDEPQAVYFGVSFPEFEKAINSKRIVWAPDGDSAFDDGSYILQFDVEENVRLVAFRRGKSYKHDKATLAETWIRADAFYSILEQWYEAFEFSWRLSMKNSESSFR
ncbi:MAG: hypothetical protein JSS02_09835 [Planctomycetes bacterium]|nr:hypothetical protein [Planctomycetota bacterium]